MKFKYLLLVVAVIITIVLIAVYFFSLNDETQSEKTPPAQAVENQRRNETAGQANILDGGPSGERRDSIDNEIRELELKVKSPQLSQAELEKAQKRLNMLRVIKAKIVEEMMEKTAR